MGVLKKYRRLGINELIHYETSKKALSKGYKGAEMS